MLSIRPPFALTVSTPESRASRRPTPHSARAPIAVTVAVAAGGALGAAVGLAAIPRIDLHAEFVGVATASASTVLTALAGSLFVRRARRTGAALDVVLTAAVTLFALVSLALTVMASFGQADGAMPLHLPVSVGVGIVVAGAFALAAFESKQGIDDPDRSVERWFGRALAAALVVVAAIVVAFDAAPGDSALVFGDLVAAGLWTAAAVGFARRSRAGEPLTMLWLGVAAAVIAAAQFSDALLLWSSSENVSSGDLIQVAGMVALLVAGLRDFEWDQRTRAQSAVTEERRRLARDLHDGLAQELAYIASRTRDSAVAEAASRALEESRAAILALSRPTDEPLERVISDTAHSIGARAAVDVTVAVRPGLDCAHDVKSALVKILREAMSNAIRHGRVETVRVSVDGPSPLVMVVADDGAGFDPTAARRPDSLGVRSMQERAENIGGRLTIESRVAAGTSVAVVVP